MISRLSSKFKPQKLNNKGQAMVEFCLVLPIFLLLIFFLFCIIQLTIAKMSVNSAAQSGCREAILYGDITKAKEKADEKAANAVENGINLTFNSSTLEKIKEEDGYEYYVYTVLFDSEGVISFENINGDGTFSSTVTMMTEYKEETADDTTDDTTED